TCTRIRVGIVGLAGVESHWRCDQSTVPSPFNGGWWHRGTGLISTGSRLSRVQPNIVSCQQFSVSHEPCWGRVSPSRVGANEQAALHYRPPQPAPAARALLAGCWHDSFLLFPTGT